MRISVYLPRFVQSCRCTCDCMKNDIDMAYKSAVLTWKIRAGASVRKDDILCEAEVEKYVFDVLSPENGCLAEIFVQDGEAADIHTAIGAVEIPSE